MMTDEDTQHVTHDPRAYGYVVDGPAVRAAPYTGPLAEVEGRMYVDGGRGEVVVRMHDAGQLGNVRWQAAERLAVNYGVRSSRFEEDVPFSRQGGRYYGEDRRVARHALQISGDALKVARFAADLPGLLAAIEQAATAAVRMLGRWVRDSAHGQRWTDTYDERHQRVERRHWRRAYIRHLAGWTGPEAMPLGEVGMPDWSDNWLSLVSRIAQAHATAVDLTAVRDHMTEALLYAQADRPKPAPAEPAPEPRTRYASVYDAIHAEPEFNDDLGDVETCYGDPAELARLAERDASTPLPRPAEHALLRPANHRRIAPPTGALFHHGGRDRTATLRAPRRPAPLTPVRPARCGPDRSPSTHATPVPRPDTASWRPHRRDRARAHQPGRPSPR